MSSSMKLLNDPISRHGLVVIPKQQITGIGNTTLDSVIIIMCKVCKNSYLIKDSTYS